MARALDHIVWPARDLDALAKIFRSLGFTVGRRNRHPWGTINHIIQFEGAFLELLGFAEDYRPLRGDDPAFPFAGFCGRFLDKTAAGAAMLVLRSHDAVADAKILQRRGLGRGQLLPFSRAAQGADGTDRTVAFTIAFADLPGLPDLGAFLCEQHRPENFWSAAAQHHANTATGIAGLTIHAPDPSAPLRELGLFAEDDQNRTEPDVTLANDARVVVTRGADATSGRIASVNLWLADLATAEASLHTAGVQLMREAGELTVTSPALGDTALVFRQKASRYPPVRASAAT